MNQCNIEKKGKRKGRKENINRFGKVGVSCGYKEEGDCKRLAEVKRMEMSREAEGGIDITQSRRKNGRREKSEERRKKIRHPAGWEVYSR